MYVMYVEIAFATVIVPLHYYMAISFNKLNPTKLRLADKLTFGKLKECRLCDIIQDHYEYLIWAEKQGFVQFSKEVEEVIQDQANFSRWQAPKEDVVVDTYDKFNGYVDSSWEEDVPF